MKLTLSCLIPPFVEKHFEKYIDYRLSLRKDDLSPIRQDLTNARAVIAETVAVVEQQAQRIADLDRNVDQAYERIDNFRGAHKELGEKFKSVKLASDTAVEAVERILATIQERDEQLADYKHEIESQAAEIAGLQILVAATDNALANLSRPADSQATSVKSLESALKRLQELPSTVIVKAAAKTQRKAKKKPASPANKV